MDDKVVRLSSMRRVIGARMCESLRETAQYTLTREIEVDALLDCIAEFRAEGRDLKLMHLLVKICCELLKKHEKLNATIVDKTLVYRGDINMGVAVALTEGLVVPNIKGAGEMTTDEIAAAYKEIIPRAKAGKLTEADITGGTFTISNLGMVGIDAFTPVINYPESAILGVGRTRKKVVVNEEGGFEVRRTVVFSITLDHRIVDGYVGALFLEDLAKVLGDAETIKDIVG